MSHELFELFVIELSFWIETNFCKNNLIIHIQPCTACQPVLSLRRRPSCWRKRGSVIEVTSQVASVWNGGVHSCTGGTIIFTLSSDLAKLNPKCHMNYSIIFTEISFYPETSICTENFKNCAVFKTSAKRTCYPF